MKKYKIICWQDVKTNKWGCIIREGDAFDWKLAPEFETKEEAIKYASSALKYWGFEFEVIDL